MNAPEYNFGFAIETSRQEVIEQNYQDWRLQASRHEVEAVLGRGAWEQPFDPRLTEEQWGHLNHDISRIERNVMRGLGELFDVVRGEGHAGDELVGTIIWWPSSRKCALRRLGNDRLWPMNLLLENIRDVCMDTGDPRDLFAHFTCAEDLLPAGFDYHAGTSALAKEIVDASVTLFDFPEEMHKMLEDAA